MHPHLPRWIVCAFVLAVVAGANAARADTPEITGFPRIKVWAVSGAWQDFTAAFPKRCVGALPQRPDSLRPQSRTITVRFLRDRDAELRPDFGGYRVYRMEGAPDTARAVLVRRFSINHGDDVLWHFSRVDSATHNLLDKRCSGEVMNDSIITFVDPDSSGSFQKVCCTTTRDSFFAIVAPPGPHNGFRLWYAVTYEALNIRDNNFEDLFVPDVDDKLCLRPDTCGPARQATAQCPRVAPCPCGTPGDRSSCANLNNKLLNVIEAPVEATGGPSSSVLGVSVVPNPFRASEAWDLTNGHEVHFTHLPPVANIRVYTISGELVRELHHNDPVHDFERWDLRNADGRDVASGIYLFRVSSDKLVFQDRFIVIR
jgi:hypothetical protein